MKTIILATTGLVALAGTSFAQSSGDAAEPFVTEVGDTAAFDGGGYTTEDGAQIYATLCAGCHMPDGSGAVGSGEYPALAGNPSLEYAAYPISIIVNGQAGMPSLGHLLDDAQVLAVTSYIQSDLSNGYESDGTAQMVADTRPIEPEAPMAEHQVAQADTDEDESDPNAMRDEAADPGSDTADTETDGTSANGAGGMSSGSGAEVVRHPIPGSDFPILQAVEVPADATLVYLSGTVPQVIDESAADDAPERFGDTAAQTVSTLEAIIAKLDAIDLEMSDVIKMQAYLVAPDGAEGMDFGGFMEGYTQFFGTDDQPNLPTRSVFEVAGLANPMWLVEIEVVAVRP